jgi:hypothetical protein
MDGAGALGAGVTREDNSRSRHHGWLRLGHNGACRYGIFDHLKPSQGHWKDEWDHANSTEHEN